ncbi:Gfo/Idh/MocA family protein [Nocardia jiangxiensis]|uniref:Gfo/Idh/MocA family protein n=1 Tax=Nocardia jiangxiensis TaxID=282685 RepID=A0ABW6SEJ3_9NOCA
MTAPQIRLGVAGLGLAGRMVAGSLDLDNRVAIVAAADPQQNARREFAAGRGVVMYPDVDGLCRDPMVDAVWVASPTRFHRRHVELAAEGGKDIIVEKPMAPSVADCDAMIAAAAKAGVLLLAAGVRSLDPTFDAMREVVESGALGRLRHLSASAYTGWLRRDRSEADMDESLGGGVVFNQAPHQVDVLRCLAGGRAVRSVRARAAAWSDRTPATGYFRAELELEDDVDAVLAYDGHGYLRSAELVASGGSASLVLADAGLVVASGSRGAVRPAGDHLDLVSDDGHSRIPIRPGDATTEAVSQLMAARTVGGAAPRHSGDWGRGTLEVVAAIVESARAGLRVPLRT